MAELYGMETEGGQWGVREAEMHTDVQRRGG